MLNHYTTSPCEAIRISIYMYPQEVVKPGFYPGLIDLESVLFPITIYTASHIIIFELHFHSLRQPLTEGSGAKKI